MPHFQQQTGRGEGPFCIEEWGPPPSPTASSRPQRQRAARPDWWGSRTSPSSTQRAQQSANESPPPAPKPEQTPGGAPRMAKANCTTAAGGRLAAAAVRALDVSPSPPVARAVEV